MVCEVLLGIVQIHLLIVISVLNDRTGLIKSFISLQCQDCQDFALRIQDPRDSSLSSSLQSYCGLDSFDLEIDHSIDSGISHSFNKAILSAQTSWTHVLFLGAGDTLASPNAISGIYHAMQSKGDCLLYSFAVNRVTALGDIVYVDNPATSRWSHLVYKNIFPHQGLVTSKQYFELYGLFSTSCRFSMDYELLLRSFRSLPPYSVHSFVLSNWVEGGVGTGKTSLVLAEYCRNRIRTGAFGVIVSQLVFVLSLMSFYGRKSFYCLRRLLSVN